LNFINSLVRNISNFVTVRDIFSAKIILLILIAFVIYSVVKKSKSSKVTLFLFLWFISPIVIYPVEKNNSYFLNIGNLYPLILLVVYIVFTVAERLKKFKKTFLALAIIGIFCINLFLIINENKNGEILFSVQNKEILSDEKKLIDYIYNNSKGDFAINSVTNPLLMNTTWAYLFDWYAKPKYKYMPHWLGYPLDSFGKDIKFDETAWSQKGKILYLIIEPTPGIPEDYIKAYIKYENTRTKLIGIKKIGNFTIEKRLLINNNNFLRDDLNKYL
jgi:hypothetical protein